MHRFAARVHAQLHLSVHVDKHVLGQAQGGR